MVQHTIRLFSKRIAYILGTDTFKILVSLFIVSLLVRLVGINYGYLNGDERINAAAKVLAGQFIPEQHFYPPLFNYINAIFFAALYAIGRIIPLWHDIEGFRATYFSMPEVFYVTARFVTALSAAAVAPLFYIVARQIGSSKIASIAATILGATLPISIYLSHIAKSDVPLASSVVLTLVLLQIKYQRPQDRLLDYSIGIALALGFSFKQSFVFIAAPLALFHLLYAYRYRREILTLKTISRISMTFIACMVVFNLAIIVDWQKFLTYQEIQSQMSVGSLANFYSSFLLWAKFATSTSRGITILSVAAFAIFPVLFLRGGWMPKVAIPLIPSWCAIVTGTIIVIAITGGRQQEGLWIPYFTAMHLFGAVIAACLIDHERNWIAIAGGAGFALILIFSLFGISRIWTEALNPPLYEELSRIVKEDFGERKIVTSVFMDVPQRRKAQQLEIARARRLAGKYGVQLPKRSPENIIQVSAPDAVFFINRPKTMYGLEDEDDESMKGIVQAYAWPLQPKEWKLDYWLERNFDVFIVGNIDGEMNTSNSRLIRTFAKELVNRCKIAKTLKANKPLFLETDVTILDCAGARR